jgi:acyl-CoA thioester hydrolase
MDAPFAKASGAMIKTMSDHPDAFELPIRVEAADIDELGHVNNVIYLRWVQDAAVAHWTAVAPTADQARLFWIVLRHEIEYLHAAHLGDQIVARTWVGTSTRLRFERHTEIVRAEDRCVLARARTVWCPIDAVTKRPTPVSAEVRSRFSVPAACDPW